MELRLAACHTSRLPTIKEFPPMLLLGPCMRQPKPYAIKTILTSSHHSGQSNVTPPTTLPNTKNAYSWNCVMRALLEGKNPRDAIAVYAQMRRNGVLVDSYSMVFAIRACGFMPGVLQGEQAHGQAFKMGFQSQVIVQTALLRMYGLFGNLSPVRQVFDEIPERDLVLWNALVAAYSQRDKPGKAISALRAMLIENVRPNEVTVVSILSACSSLRRLEEGKQVHGYVIKNILGFDKFVRNALINMYAGCSCLLSASRIFDDMKSRDVVSWTCMVNGYSINNCPSEALALFREMELANVSPDKITLLGVISICGRLGSFEMGEWVEDYVKRSRSGVSTRMANALIDMHAKCGNIKRACEVFDKMKIRTLVSWTTMIQGLAMHGHGLAALLRFSQMQREGFRPDEIFFLSILGACSHAGLVEEGRQCFRSMVEEHGMEPWMEHYGSVVDLLCRARLVDEALEFVDSMPVKPDMVIWRALMGACKDQGDINLARSVMNHLLESEPKDGGNYILISNLYATIGEWNSVRNVRNEMGARGVTKSDPGRSLIESSMI